MDILLSIVQLDESRYEELLPLLKESNLEKDVKWEIISILETAVEQTKQAKNMGWL